MLETIAYFARWAQLSANLILFGSCFFLAVTWQKSAVLAVSSSWLARLEKTFPWLSAVVVLGLIGILATTTGDATGNTDNIRDPGAWLAFIQQTQVGLIALVRIILGIILFTAVIYLLRKTRKRWHYIFCTVIATFPLIAGTFVSHSSADEMSFTAIAPFTLHILLAGLWFGALPVFLLIVFNSEKEFDKVTRLLNVAYLEKFSTMALPVMLLLAITGLIVTDRMVDDYYHTLVSSPYGWLLILKLTILSIILVIAYEVRNKWLPLLSQVDISAQIKGSAVRLKKWVRIEFILASLLMLVAIILANTLPAKHTIIENWPLPFRFALDTTSEESIDEELFWFGTALFFIAISVVCIGIKLNWNWKKKIAAPGLLAITALAIAIPPITYDAYPETYLKPLIPLDAISISNGAHLYAEHCADCHGPQGKGNGSRAGTLSTEPTDLLTEPHTVRHTVGNFFHWIAQGIPGTDMPGFTKILDEEDIWDVVNFMHALSRGFDARLLGSMIIPERPAVGAPVFFYGTHEGASGDLKDFRLKKNVILVLFSWPQSQQRLIQLKHAYARILHDHNTEVLAIPLQNLTPSELEAVTEIASFPIVTDGWPEIKDTYTLYRRVRVVPDLNGPGLTPVHLEFMIDRFGYLRARWNSQFEGFGWQNFSVMTQQLDLLNKEDEIMPPPDDHAH